MNWKVSKDDRRQKGEMIVRPFCGISREVISIGTVFFKYSNECLSITSAWPRKLAENTMLDTNTFET